MTTSTHSLIQHIKAVKKRQRRFENAFQGVSRMILEGGIEKTTVNGKTTSDFRVFRTGPKRVIGMFDEINSFVSYVKDAAEGGASKSSASSRQMRIDTKSWKSSRAAPAKALSLC